LHCRSKTSQRAEPRKGASLGGNAQASIPSHMYKNESIQFPQAKRALVHRISFWQARHHLE